MRSPSKPVIVLSVAFVTASAYAIEVFRPLAARLAASDFVGVVEIRATWPSPGVKLREDEYVGVYRQRADAYVIETLAGEHVSGRITINFDTGSACDENFRESARYIVFLTAKDDGTYSPVTMSKYEVVDDTVDHWERRAEVPLHEVRRDITAAIVGAAVDAGAPSGP